MLQSTRGPEAAGCSSKRKMVCWVRVDAPTQTLTAPLGGGGQAADLVAPKVLPGCDWARGSMLHCLLARGSICWALIRLVFGDQGSLVVGTEGSGIPGLLGSVWIRSAWRVYWRLLGGVCQGQRETLAAMHMYASDVPRPPVP